MINSALSHLRKFLPSHDRAPPETKTSSVGSDLAFVWRLIKTYWGSRSWKSALVLVVFLFGLNVIMVRISVAFIHWTASFTDALVAKNQTIFHQQLFVGIALIFAWSIAITVGGIVKETIQIRWRACLTESFLANWFEDSRFARVEQAKLVENADQRISQDIAQAPLAIGNLIITFFNSITMLASFTVVLWNSWQEFHLQVLGRPVDIPGAMVWLAVAFAALQTAVAHFAGRAVTKVTVLQERYEADFRSGLMRVREYSDSIALENGKVVEQGLLAGRFERVRRNFIAKIIVTHRLGFLIDIMGRFVGVVPMLLSAPRVMSGDLTIGRMTEIGTTFGIVCSCLSWVAESYDRIAETRATVQRLELFDRALRATEHGEIERVVVPGSHVAATSLVLRRPDDAHLLTVNDVRFEMGERVIVCGPSGSGKSTFLRALAGLWPYGSGTIEMGLGHRIMFLPQIAYLPEGDLATALAYPRPPSFFATADYANALARVELSSYVASLRVVDAWSRRMSPGEKQRLSFARVLLNNPDFVFLDEATSALDPALEEHVYRVLTEDLPTTGIVSVAHRPNVARFHERRLSVVSSASSEASLTEAAKALA